MYRKRSFEVQKLFFLVARLWVGLAFIGMAIDIMMQWHEVTEAFVDQVGLVQCVASGWHCKLVGWMHTSSGLFVGLGVGLSLLGGLLILIGYRVSIASFFLLLVLGFQVVFLHPFWLLEGAERGQAVAFLWSAIVNAGALLFCMGLSKKKPPTEKWVDEPESRGPMS